MMEKNRKTGDTTAVTIKSNTAALRGSPWTIGYLWDKIKNNFKAETTESHMIKNSEWGAVAYLTESKYGRNGTEISVNQCNGVITGAGRGETRCIVL